MKLLAIIKNIFLLFITTVVFSACKGQVSNNIPKDSINDTAENSSGETKTTKIKSVKNSNINSAIKDKNGNLWFGTASEGVYFYDGKTFTHFTEKEGLYSNHVSAILEAKNGEIWIGTNAGISRYDGKKFTNFPVGITSGTFLKTYKAPDDPKTRVPKNAVWSMYQDKSGKIWIGTWENGVYCYDGKTLTQFLQNDGVINKSNIQLNAVNTILEDKTSKIWFSTWFSGLCVYDGREIIAHKPNNEVWFASLMEDKDGKIWIGRRQNGLIVFDGKTFTNVSQNGTLDSCGPMPLLQDKAGNIWFGSIHSNMTLRDTHGGLWRYDGKQFYNFTAKDGLENNDAWSAVEDNEGNIWFGTTNNGLYRYDGKSFTGFTE